MQTQLAGPALRGSARNASPESDHYVRGLSRCVLEALDGAPSEVQRAARDAGLWASIVAVINAVVLEINGARAA